MCRDRRERLAAGRQEAADGVDEMVFSLDATGLATGKISAPLASSMVPSFSRETISRITNTDQEIHFWQHGPSTGSIARIGNFGTAIAMLEFTF